MNVLSRLLLAASFVTAFPLARRCHDAQGPDMSGLTKYLPGVGLLIGLVLAGSAFVCHQLMVPALVSGALLTAWWIALSGAIHLDGLMDTADGVFSHRSRERMLEIMHDSRVGNFGAIAGILLILLKFAALASMPFPMVQVAVLLIPVWGRFSETLVIGCFPYARPEGMGKIWHDTTRCPRDIIIAAVVPLLLTALLCLYAPWTALVALSLAAILTGALASCRLQAILGGQTGDTYGAVVELSEVGALLFACVLL